MTGIGSGEGGLQKFLVLYVVVWSISPPLEIDLIYRLAALGCVGLWGLIALQRGLYVEKMHVYAVLFAVVVAGVAYMQSGSFDAILKQIPIYILVVCFILNCFYRERWEELSGIVPIVLVLLIFFNWKTGTTLLEDATIARKLVRADESVYMYLRQGVGGYSLIYPQVCIFPAILAWIIRAYYNNKKCFLLGAVWLVAYIRCILNAGYAIAIFATIAGAVILLAFKGRSAAGAAIASLVIFAAGLGAILYIESVREFLLVQFDGTAIAKKIQDLMMTSEEGAAEGSIYMRMEAYKGSWDVILKYPLLGGLWRRSGGGHSALLDAFAKYGVLGGCMYVKMIYSVPGYYKKQYDHRLINAVSNSAIVALLFVSVLDSFTYSFMPMILIVLPLLYEDIIRWEKISS